MRETLSSEISPHTIATVRSREVETTADWWTAFHSAFAGSDGSLCLYETVENVGGIELSKYWTVGEGTDESREKYQGLAEGAGSALSPPPGVEPMDHWHNELYQEEKHSNDQTRGIEEIFRQRLSIGAREDSKTQESRLAFQKALRAAKYDENKAAEIARGYGISQEFIHAMQNEKYIETRKTCVIPRLGLAAAAFCSQLARRAHLEAEVRKLERHKTKRGKIPDEKIIDRDREMARLAFEDKPIEVIAIHLDDLEFSTPKTWKKPKYAPKGEKYMTGIRVLKLRQSFLQMISRAKKKYPAPAPSCLA